MDEVERHSCATVGENCSKDFKFIENPTRYHGRNAQRSLNLYHRPQGHSRGIHPWMSVLQILGRCMMLCHWDKYYWYTSKKGQHDCSWWCQLHWQSSQTWCTHNDIRAENILLDSNVGIGHVNLIDFGMAPWADQKKRGNRLRTKSANFLVCWTITIILHRNSSPTM